MRRILRHKVDTPQPRTRGLRGNPGHRCIQERISLLHCKGARPDTLRATGSRVRTALNYTGRRYSSRLARSACRPGTQRRGLAPHRTKGYRPGSHRLTHTPSEVCSDRPRKERLRNHRGFRTAQRSSPPRIFRDLRNRRLPRKGPLTYRQSLRRRCRWGSPGGSRSYLRPWMYFRIRQPRGP